MSVKIIRRSVEPERAQVRIMTGSAILMPGRRHPAPSLFICSARHALSTSARRRGFSHRPRGSRAIRRADTRAVPGVRLSLNADSKIFAWLCGAKQSARKKVPWSVRVLLPDAEGRPSLASIASSIAMFAEPPGPQP